VAVLAIAGAAALRIALRVKYGSILAPELWEFGEIAQNLLRTGIYTFRSNGVPSAFMPPAYPLLIAALYSVFGVGPVAHGVLAGILFLFEMALPVLIGWLAATIWDRNTGIVAFWVALFWPQFLLMSGRCSSIQIYMVVLVFACAIVLTGQISLGRRACLAGFALGVYSLFRFEAVPFLLPFGYFLLRETKSSGTAAQSNSTSRRAAGVLGLFLLSFAIPLSPWLIRNYAVFGRVVLSTSGGYNLRRGHHEGATGTAREMGAAGAGLDATTSGGTPVPGASAMAQVLEHEPADVLMVDQFFRDEALSFVFNNPGREARLVVTKLFYFFTTDFTHPASHLIPVWLASLVALGFGFYQFVARGLHDTKQQLLWLAFTVQGCVAVAFFVLPRYRIAVDFVPVVFASAWIASSVLPSATAWFSTKMKKRGITAPLP
jgi:hypothetical protein